MAKAPSKEIRAAGVVLLRGYGGNTEVCVVHRPNHKDWSLPKGKLDPGEDIISAAVRETLEETGENVVLGVPLKTQRYRVIGGDKSVRYWVGRIRPGGPGFHPNREIDDLQWLPPRKAAERLSYNRDVELMRSAVRAEQTTPLIILRHAQAVRRADWGKKPDTQRPLAASGAREASRIPEVLAAYGITNIHSSDAVRCIDTVRPYSNKTGRAIALEHRFSEQGFFSPKQDPYRGANELLTQEDPLVLCTHRPVLPPLMKHIAKELGVRASHDDFDPALPPGGFIVLHRAFTSRGPQLAAVERHVPEKA